MIHDWLIRNGSAPALAAIDAAYSLAFRFHSWSLPVRWKPVYNQAVRTFAAAVTNVCNARCSFCAYPKKPMERGTMPMGIFRSGLKAWRDAGGTKIDLTPTVGDPLVDRALESKICEAKEAGLNVSFTTNAILLAARTKSLLDAGLDELFISLPSFNRLIYRSVYGVDKARSVSDGVWTFLKSNRDAGEPCRVRLRFRNAEKPSHILRSPEFAQYVRPFLSRRVSVNFTVGFDNWGGTVRESDMFGSMRLKQQKDAAAPCEGLFGLAMLHDGKLRACACRFKETDHDDLVVGHISDGLEPARRRAMAIAEGFWSGDRPETCRGCTLYHPARL